MAIELQPYGITVFSLVPDKVLTEMFQGRVQHGFIGPNRLTEFKSPQFVGSCVVAIACDSNSLARSGQVWRTRDLAMEYNLPFLDGSYAV